MICVKWFCEAVRGKYWLRAWLLIVKTEKNKAAESVKDVINFILPSFKLMI